MKSLKTWGESSLKETLICLAFIDLANKLASSSFTWQSEGKSLKLPIIP